MRRQSPDIARAIRDDFMSKPKLLITGASGWLGWHLCQKASQSWDVYGTYCSHPLAIPSVKLCRADLTDYPTIKRLFAEINPAAVIHTAAQSQPNYCQQYPAISEKINVVASLNLAGLSAEYEIPCVFTSTDLVFDGLSAPYRETDPVSPISYYGEQKVKAEVGMLQRNPATKVCRMPLMFGTKSPVSSSFIQSFIKKLQKKQILTLFSDEFRTPISAETASKGLLLALEKHTGGVLHLGGRERISRLNFGYLMAEILGLSSELIKPCLQQEVSMPAPRPPDTSLDSHKAFALGYAPPLLSQELLKLKVALIETADSD